MAKLRGAYAKRTGVEVTLRHANLEIPDATQVKDLNHFRDNIIVFTAHVGATASPAMASGTPSQSRAALQPINTQHRNLHPAVEAETKPENAYLTPYSGTDASKPASFPSPNVKMENGDRFTHSSTRQASRSPYRAAFSGFTQYGTPVLGSLIFVATLLTISLDSK